MSKLKRDLYDAKRNIPFVYELYKDDNKEDVDLFLKENHNDDSIVITYDAKDNEMFLAYWIDEIYSYYNMEAPENIKQYKKLGLDLTKVGLFTAGMVLSGGTAIILSFLSGGITVWENMEKIKNAEDNNKEATAMEALKLFSKEKDSIAEPELLILGGIRLLYQLSKIKDVVFYIKNPQFLSKLDIQFLRIYYNLFKDKSSRIQLNSEIDPYNKDAYQEAESRILTILDWDSLDSDSFSKLDGEDRKDLLMKLRWFLRRYRMIEDSKSNIPSQLVGEDVFVGRANILEQLKDDFRKVSLENTTGFRRIQGNSGMGKTTLANNFVDQVISRKSNREVIVLKSSYSGESSSFRGGLTEIRTVINHLKIKTDNSLRKNIEEKLHNSYQDNMEFANWLKGKFDDSCNFESLLTPLMELAGGNLGRAGKVLTTISTAGGLSDVVEAAKTSMNSYLRNQKPEIISKNENKDIHGIIEDLFFEFLDLCNNTNNKIIWIIDDLQWVDKDSASFLYKVLKSKSFNKTALYIILLEREADFTSRLTHTKDSEILNKLEKKLGENTVKLKGFGKDEIRSLLEVSIRNKKGKARNGDLVSEKLWNWFIKLDQKQSIEPLFLVESINLLAEQVGDNQILVLDNASSQWNWIEENIDEIGNRLDRILFDWSQGTSSNFEAYGFTPSGIAILEERLYRLKNHFPGDKGCNLLSVLEVGAFMGEPFMIDAAASYLKDLGGNKHNIERELDETENIYGMILKYSRYIADDRLLAYLYSHHLYRQYMKLKFEKNIDDLKEAHSKIFKCMENFIKNNEIDDHMTIDIYEQSIDHALKSKDPQISPRAIQYALLLANIYSRRTQARKQLLVLNKAIKLCDLGEEENDSLKTIIKFDIVKLHDELGEYDQGLEIVYETMKNGKLDLGWDIDFKQLECLLLHGKGEFNHAIRKGEGVIKAIEKLYGRDSEEYKVAMDNQAQILERIGEADKARSIQEDLLAWSIDRYGEDHSETLIYKDNLANTYNTLGYCEEALKLEREVHSAAKEVWGEKSKHRIINMSKLAGTLVNLGIFPEALEVSNKAYELAKSIYGERNPLSLQIMSNLAVAYRGLGQLKEALDLNLKIMDIKEEILTKDHWEVITSKNNLSKVYFDMGDYANAEVIQKSVVNEMKEKYPKNTNDIVVCLLTMGKIYRMQKNYTQAKNVIEEIEILCQDIPSSHIIKLRVLMEATILYYELNDLENSIKASKEILLSVTKNNLYNIANSEFITGVNYLFPMLFGESRNIDTIEFAKKIIENDKIKLDADREALIFYYLSFAYLKVENIEDAMVYVDKSLKKLEGLEEIDMVEFADTIYLKAIVERKSGNYKQALKLCEQAEEIYINNKGQRYKSYDLLIEKSMVYVLKGDWLIAARNQRDVITIGDKILKEDNKDRIIQRERIVNYYGELKNWGRGRAVTKEALDLANKYHPHDKDLIDLLRETYKYMDMMYKK